MSIKGRAVISGKSEVCSGPMLVTLLSTSFSYEVAFKKLAVTNIIGPNAEESMALVDIHDTAPIRSQKNEFLKFASGIRLSWEEFKASPMGNCVEGRPIFMRDCLVPDGKNPSTRVLEAAELLGRRYDEVAAELEIVKDEVAKRMELLRQKVDYLTEHKSSGEAARMLQKLMELVTGMLDRVSRPPVFTYDDSTRGEQILHHSTAHIAHGLEDDDWQRPAESAEEQPAELPERPAESAKGQPAEFPGEGRRVALEKRKKQSQLALPTPKEAGGLAQAAPKAGGRLAQAKEWLEKGSARIEAERLYEETLDEMNRGFESLRAKRQTLDEAARELAAEEGRRAAVMRCSSETLRSAYDEVKSLVDDLKSIGDQRLKDPRRVEWLRGWLDLGQQGLVLRSYLKVTHMPFRDALLYWTRSRLDAALLLRLELARELPSRGASTNGEGSEERKEESRPSMKNGPTDREDVVIEEVVKERIREEAEIEDLHATSKTERESAWWEKLTGLRDTINQRRKENWALSEIINWEETFPSTEENWPSSEDMDGELLSEDMDGEMTLPSEDCTSPGREL